MRTISIITPWAGDTAADLLPDYSRAVAGAEVITVDNASAAATAAALKQWHAEHGIYLRNETNAGFAAGNNQGYAHATGDIIIFLNSDVAPSGDWLRMVAADVRDGALYGPELGQQCVGGRWLPYLSGWCIAATRATWEQLIPAWSGPWDDEAFPGPYWEDNDLCLRALQAGLSLVQTAWPIQHKGGRTAGPLTRWAASFEVNRRTFGERVAAATNKRTNEQTNNSPMYAAYMQQVYTQSDIQHHLPLLFSLARGNVLELGTRSGVSTAALLAGVEQHGGHVWSVDLDPRSAQVAAGHPLWTFVQADSRDAHAVYEALPADAARYSHLGQAIDSPVFDLILVDTLHTYTHVQQELDTWWRAVKPGGHICIHDPETFPGVRRAVQEFCDARGWPVTFVLPCNGMAVIEVPPAQPVERAGAAIEQYLAGAK